jgi:hypothetical protein
VPRAPLPNRRVTPVRATSQVASESVTPPSLVPPRSSGLPVGHGVFAGCCQSLLQQGPSQHYPCTPSVGAWTHTPPSSPSAHAQFFLGDSGLASREPRSADGTTPAMQLPQGAIISGRQSFASLQAPTLARPPGCTDRNASHAEPLGRLRHASPGQLPGPSCGIATCPIWAIDTVGLSPTGLQSCWLLLPTSGSSATLTSQALGCKDCDIPSAWVAGNIQGTEQSP